MRVPASGPPGLVYLPDSTPPPSGLHAATVIPNASAIGSSSRSMSRLSRLYGTWRPTNGVQPRHSASVLARETTQAGRVGDADVEHLAGAHRVVERPHRLLDRGVPVPEVHPVEVDVVGAQPAQAGLQRQR